MGIIYLPELDIPGRVVVVFSIMIPSHNFILSTFDLKNVPTFIETAAFVWHTLSPGIKALNMVFTKQYLNCNLT